MPTNSIQGPFDRRGPAVIRRAQRLVTPSGLSTHPPTFTGALTFYADAAEPGA